MPMMSKKHFDFIASVIEPLSYELSAPDFRLVVDRFSDMLVETNDMFNRDLFENACGVNELDDYE